MTNKELARWFNRLAKIMELHGENPFKIRSYQNAYVQLRKWPDPLADRSLEDLQAIKGIGKAIAEKIRELATTGDLSTYRKYAEKTPAGVLEILSIPGIGPKKVRALWQELGVESVAELLYACMENRLVELKGFGPKTQADLIDKLTFYQQTKGQLRWPEAATIAEKAQEDWHRVFPDVRCVFTGGLRRKTPVVERIDLLVESSFDKQATSALEGEFSREEGCWLWQRADTPPIHLWTADPLDWGRRLWETTGADAYVQEYVNRSAEAAPTEEAYCESAGLPLHIPEWRETRVWAEDLAHRPGRLVTDSDIRGQIHAHSTWSDGVQSIREMAEACIARGLEYLVLTDHSQAAFYAQGLTPERVVAQWHEIESLNRELAPFRIFKGIEADILADGQLDYDAELRAGFDVVIASIHSNLRMDESKAMHRLLTAIENPHTRILGHPTGRLLLGRPGYPIDHRAVIRACAEHDVVIELNANPHRLDLDYHWIPEALDQGVMIAINTDAHSVQGFDDLTYGVQTARKGGLSADMCLNAKGLDDFLAWLKT